LAPDAESGFAVIFYRAVGALPGVVDKDAVAGMLLGSPADCLDPFILSLVVEDSVLLLRGLATVPLEPGACERVMNMIAFMADNPVVYDQNAVLNEAIAAFCTAQGP